MYIIIIFPNINIVTFRVVIGRKKKNEKKVLVKVTIVLTCFFCCYSKSK